MCRIITNADISVKWSISAPLFLLAYHAVVHDFIPVFPGDNAKENSDRLACRGEVGVSARWWWDRPRLRTTILHLLCCSNQTLPVDVLSVLNSAEENDASKGIAEEKEEHPHDDEEALVHADDHRQQQHLQCHLDTVTIIDYGRELLGSTLGEENAF